MWRTVGLLDVQILARGNSGATGMESMTQFNMMLHHQGVVCVSVCVRASHVSFRNVPECVCLFVRMLFMRKLFVVAGCSRRIADSSADP